jgi:hypothetical protein
VFSKPYIRLLYQGEENVSWWLEEQYPVTNHQYRTQTRTLSSLSDFKAICINKRSFTWPASCRLDAGDRSSWSMRRRLANS